MKYAAGAPRGLDAPREPLIERAFALAASGTCVTLSDMVRVLQAEGYRNIQAHLGGRTIKAQLRQLREAAAAQGPNPPNASPVA